MRGRFPVLRVLSAVLRAVGWILALFAVAYLAGEVVTALAAPPETSLILPRAVTTGIAVVRLAVGIFGLVFGLIAAALGEALRVLLAIEENTRARPPA